MEETQNIQYVVDYLESLYNIEDEFDNFYKKWKICHPNKYLSKAKQESYKNAFSFWKKAAIETLKQYIKKENNGPKDYTSNAEKNEYKNLQKTCTEIINNANIDIKTKKIKNIENLFVLTLDEKEKYAQLRKEVFFKIFQKGNIILDPITFN